MRSDPRKFLYDIASAAATIRAFCDGLTLKDYERELMLRSACERQFEIIGEAMTRLRDRHSDVFAKLDDGPVIIAFRNRLIHGYDTVDSEIVWDVIESKLPRLLQAAEALLAAQA
ncbi:MAG: HepT-like ribonuclease domain-containing protein [Gemmatimonadaceae bacterium]